MQLIVISTDFWKLKRRVDSEIKRLGWSEEEKNKYIQKHYAKRSLLVMTDIQLRHMASRLWFLGRDSDTPAIEQKIVADRKRRRKRRD